MKGAHNCAHSRSRSLENGRAQLRACSGDAAQTGLWCHAGAQAPPPRLLRETTTFDGDAGQERSTQRAQRARKFPKSTALPGRATLLFSDWAAEFEETTQLAVPQRDPSVETLTASQFFSAG